MRLEANSAVWRHSLSTDEYTKRLDDWLKGHGLRLAQVLSLEARPGTGCVAVTAITVNEQGHPLSEYDAMTGQTTRSTYDEVLPAEGFPEPDWEGAAKKAAERVEALEAALRRVLGDLAIVRGHASIQTKQAADLGRAVEQALYPPLYPPRTVADEDDGA